MHSWRNSAAYRIAFANFIAFALGLALLGVVVFAVMHMDFSRQLDAMMKDEVQTLVDEYHSGGNQNLADAIAEREASGTPTRLLYAVFTPDGRRIIGGLQARRPPLGMHEISFIDPNEGPDTARALAVDLSPRERLVVAADQEWLERIDDTVIGVFGVAFLLACIIALAGAAFLGSYLRRRLRSISGAAETIIAGDIRERMPVSSRRDEFDQVAVTLNRMLDRIEGLMENLRQVSSDVAHDLRTPLARLRTRLEQGIQQSARGGDTRMVIEQSIKQVDEVLALFAAILRIAEVESGQPRRSFTPVDLSALVTDLGESFAPAVHDGGRELFWSVEPGADRRWRPGAARAGDRQPHRECAAAHAHGDDHPPDICFGERIRVRPGDRQWAWRSQRRPAPGHSPLRASRIEPQHVGLWPRAQPR